MKVTTEACLFGAWVAENIPGKVRSVLDIGTGTGVLSLMIAQTTSCDITAVEIDEAAATQASENFMASPWHDQLQIIQQDITSMDTRKKFDIIISNPPFYEKSLASPFEKINLARHDSGLELSALMKIAKSLLNENGIFFLLFPSSRSVAAISEAANSNLYPRKIASVKQTNAHEVFREMIAFSFAPARETEGEIIQIREGQDYSERFRELLKNFYLSL